MRPQRPVGPQPVKGSKGTSRPLSAHLQAHDLRPAIALLEQAADQVPLPVLPQPIVIADYGAADGNDSLKPLSRAIDVLRRRTRHDHPILVAHTDGPENDFTALFKTLADEDDSYLSKDAATFASAIGRSFFRQIVPSNTVNLGWTSWATHRLSRVPQGAPELGDHVHVAFSKDDRARAAYAEQAAMDWHDFVAYRGRELCPAGRLVVLTRAVDADGDFGYQPLFDALDTALRDQVRDGLLRRDELRRMVIPTFARSERDFRAPFTPRGRFEGLTIDHLEVFVAKDQFWDRFQLDGEAEAFGSHWAAFARKALFGTLAAALDSPVDSRRVVEFTDQLEAAVAARLASVPEQMRMPLASIVLTKRDRPG